MAKILVVDDEVNWLELCADRLSELGHEVRSTADCAKAYGEIKADPPDVVILDLRMPVGGRLMLYALRQDWPQIPVIIHTVYSGYKDDPDLARVDGFVVKSPDLSELAAAVDKVLARSRVP